ncbi:MAG: hypothetical protein AAF696_32580, partial [Bacteroidota bacterium]
KEKPYKLLWKTTGNLRNKLLSELFEKNFTTIQSLFEERNVIELSHTEIIVKFFSNNSMRSLLLKLPVVIQSNL